MIYPETKCVSFDFKFKNCGFVASWYCCLYQAVLDIPDVPAPAVSIPHLPSQILIGLASSFVVISIPL